VKSNIGHTQTAAGAAGVIKMVLALQHGALPRTLHVEEPSPHIDWSAGDVRLLTEPVPWPAADGRPRRAGISSFGMSGTNVHVILEEAPVKEALAEEAPAGDAAGAGAADSASGLRVLGAGAGVHAWLVSGRSGAALTGQAGQLAGWAGSRPGLDPGDAAWSLATTRSLFEHRAVVTGAGLRELTAGLAAVAAGEPSGAVAGTPGARAVSGQAPAGGPGRVAFVFAGQGAQWPGMGTELAAASPAFAARLAECSAALEPLTGWRVEDVLAGAAGAPPLDGAQVVQPALWAVMVSLAAAWEAAGVAPDAVTGHSQGEVTAATVAGILSLADAALVITARSRALATLGDGGGMLSVVMPAARVRGLLAPWAGRLQVAAVNSPAATVVSGDAAALAELGTELAARRVMRWAVPDTGFVAHSPRLNDLAAALGAELAGIRPGPGRVPMYSTVTGKRADGTELDAAYWFANLRREVAFAPAVRALADAGHRVFVEVSPHPVLTTAIAETLTQTSAETETGATGPGPVITETLRRDDGGPARLLASLAEVHVAGVPVDWTAVIPPAGRVELPTYAFQHRRYWPDKPSLARPPATVDGSATATEARFWTAVDSGDVTGLADTLAVDEPGLAPVIEAIASWRRRGRAEAAAEDWQYQVTWVRGQDSAPVAVSGTWLLAVPAEPPLADLAEQCAQVMAAAGATVVTVLAGPAGTGRAELAARIRQALEGKAAGDAALSGVMSLLALDEAPLPGLEAVPGGLAATLTLVQALGDMEVAAPLWVATRGAVAAVPGEEPGAEQATAWGLGRVVALEHPGRWGGLIDLPPHLDEQAGTRLRVVLAGCGEDQVAIRPAGIFARRMVHAAPPQVTRPWAPSGTVLVTGGTGALGGHVARWLASRTAARVILSSRSGPAVPGVAVLAAELAAAGTAVQVTACDAASREELAGLIARAAADSLPVGGVFHTAGVNRSGPVADITATDLRVSLAAKAAGAAYLDELTRDLELNAFVVFSSVSAVWGSAWLAGYAAANAFLDALAEARHARGLAATSVAWGQWAGDGMGGEEAEAQLQRLGVRLMDPALAVASLAQVLDGGQALATVADVDWARFVPIFTVRRPSPLLADLAEQALDATLGAAGGDGLVAELAGLNQAERERLVTAVVRTHAAAVLGHASVDAVEEDRAFGELGFDSLTAVELRNRLVTVTGLRLPGAVIFDYPTPGALGRQLVALLTQAGAGDGRPGGHEEDGGPRYVAADGRLAGGAASFSLSGLYAEAARAGRSAELMRTLAGLAAFRPTFAGIQDIASLPALVPLARGPQAPVVMLFSSYFGRSSIGEYARLAHGFRGAREVLALPQPGFVGGEPLPATVDALISVQAEIIRRSVDDRPFVLAGHSAGGIVAHAVAARLAAEGIVPAGMVLMDTFSPGRSMSGDQWSELVNAMLVHNHDDGADDAWVTAMVHYLTFDWAGTEKTDLPTLQVRPADQIGGSAVANSGVSHYLECSSNIAMVDVPGDHFTMLGDHAGTTAQAVNQWLAEL
jgi:acyl transferase domain-containing protein